MPSFRQIFFHEHDPTRRSKCQYKSAVWYHGEAQLAAVRAVVAGMEAKFGVKVATTVDPVGVWYDAEEYHQKYIEKSMSRRGTWGAW
ncbi:Peptide methionine sulfoxide reductase [Tetrabaena socialis]|uniref:peptide-methionine (S)-S-oxide reductase n=1 Tax=Tetrabaena socialis TaxID=47790 RepID=A0A2J8ABY8_9CHLO|nr:Peptide methionine sulfoxide reductase [Tetrabaena socialis]|eukprot:PNH10035.1 Peptide methionine sulfoxide reductase [Tetrabaena socialis]